MWREIKINRQNIKAESGKAVLVACPRHSPLNGFRFWHPLSLVRVGDRLSSIRIRYTDDFVFRLKKYGQGKYNRGELIEERHVGYMDVEEAFGQNGEMTTIHIPDELEPEGADADKELIDEASEHLARLGWL